MNRKDLLAFDQDVRKRLGLEQVPLDPAEVQVWIARLESTTPFLPLLQPLLSSGEKARADRFRFERHSRWFVARRALLKLILGHRMELPPDQLHFGRHGQGKPVLEQLRPAHGRLHFNHSHSEGVAFYASAWNREIGVDIERVRSIKDAPAIVNYCFTPEESEHYRSLPEEIRDLAFIQCWTGKEAYLKAIGQGLYFPLKNVVVSFGPGESARIVSVKAKPDAPARWRLIRLQPLPGYVATICLETSGKPIDAVS